MNFSREELEKEYGDMVDALKAAPKRAQGQAIVVGTLGLLLEALLDIRELLDTRLKIPGPIPNAADVTFTEQSCEHWWKADSGGPYCGRCGNRPI